MAASVLLVASVAHRSYWAHTMGVGNVTVYPMIVGRVHHNTTMKWEIGNCIFGCTPRILRLATQGAMHDCLQICNELALPLQLVLP